MPPLVNNISSRSRWRRCQKVSRVSRALDTTSVVASEIIIRQEAKGERDITQGALEGKSMR
jgi:hypothetical protein